MKRTGRRLAAAAISVCLILTMSVSVFAAAVTKEDAVKTALADAGLKKSGTSRLTVQKDGQDYEIEFRDKKTGDKYEYEISIQTGRILEAETEYKHALNNSGEKVGKTKVIAAAAKKAGVKKSTVKKGTCRYKKEDGEWVYELKFKTKSCRYEIEILAPTGAVIEYSREYSSRS